MHEQTPILYVDDEPNNLLLFRMAFRDELDVRTAANAGEALQLLEREPVAVLLADHRMPGMSGMELVARARSRYPLTERMIVTAYAETPAALRAIQAGLVARYIFKPWRTEELRAVLLEARERYHAKTKLAPVELEVLRREHVEQLTADAAHHAQHAADPIERVRDGLARLASAQGEDGVTLSAARAQARSIALELDKLGRLAPPPARLAPAIHDLAEVVGSALGLCDAELRERVAVEYLRAEVVPVRGDAAALTRALIHLLVALAQPWSAGSLAQPTLRLRARRDGDLAFVEVSYRGLSSAPKPSGLRKVREELLSLGATLEAAATSYRVRMPCSVLL